MRSSLERSHGAKFDDAIADNYLAGKPGIRLRGRFVLVATIDENPVRMACLSRVYVVFHRDLAVTIGLSGAQNKRYFRESEFEAILASICLD